jgi:sugar phosphate isomerase/epimerase
MLRCFSTLGCPELSLDEVFALAQRHGIPGVELRALAGTTDLSGYFAREFGSPARLAQRVAAAGVNIVAFDASLRLVGASDAEREQTRSLGPWAQALGVRWLRAFDGGKQMDAAELAAALETLRWWQAERRQHGWTAELMIETHDALVTAEAIGRFLAAAPGTSILWDAHHTWRKGGEDPALTWAAIRESVVHVHVKDSIAVPSARHPFTYVLPGDGGFPVARTRERLRADGFAGSMSLEWERMWHPYLPPLENALAVANERAWW